MTIAVDLGRKATKPTNQQLISISTTALFGVSPQNNTIQTIYISILILKELFDRESSCYISITAIAVRQSV